MDMPNNKDIYVSETGSMHRDGKSYKSFKLFEYRENEDCGKGFQYSRGGGSHSHYWAHPHEEDRFVDIPSDIMFSFKHGSCSFYIEEDLIKDCADIESIIRASDFKFITEEHVKIAKITESIKTFDDVRENWAHIKENGANYLIAELCLKEAGAIIPEVVNGEIGIHAMMVMGAYMDNIENIGMMVEMS